jgi:DNA-binding SARP family transcriptional activator
MCLQVYPEEIDVFRFERLVAEARSAPVAARAERLRAALSLWRGPALADVSFGPFVVAEARRLEALRLTALEDRIEAVGCTNEISLQAGRVSDFLCKRVRAVGLRGGF